MRPREIEGRGIGMARRRTSACLLSGAAALLVSMALVGTAHAAPGQITDFPLPAESYPDGITASPDGNLWFTEWQSDKIGRITTEGQVAEYALPSTFSHPDSIASATNGALWFTAEDNRIGSITPSGQIAGFAVPHQPTQITPGPDGNMWFSERETSAIGQITPGGQITEFPLPAEYQALGITSGPDGNLWFTESKHYTIYQYEIGRITPSGQISEFPVKQEPAGITAGPDGNMWFTEAQGCDGEEGSGAKIGRITPSGRIDEFPLLASPGGHPYSITAGPDGNLWFYGFLFGPGCRGYDAGYVPSAISSQVGNINPIGQHHVTDSFTSSEALSPSGPPHGAITAGPDGNLWFTEPRANRIDRLFPGLPGESTIGLANFRATDRRGWVKLQVGCVGGSAESPCRGTLKLRFASHGSSSSTVSIGHRHYTIPSEGAQRIEMWLPHRALGILSDRSLLLTASATSSDGQAESEEFVLPK